MKFDDFKKKENPLVKFMNKYFGMKYSIVFAFGKQLLNEKPTATSIIGLLTAIYTMYFMVRYSRWFLWCLSAWILAYGIQVAIKLIIKKRKKNDRKN